MANSLDDNLFEGTFNKDKNYQDSVLRANGYNPNELSDDEKKELLEDLDDRQDPDDTRLSDITPPADGG